MYEIFNDFKESSGITEDLDDEIHTSVIYFKFL